MVARRWVLGGGAALAVVGGVLGYRRIEDELHAIIAREFGGSIVDAPETGPFIADVAAVWRGLAPARDRALRPTLWTLAPLVPVLRRERENLSRNVVELFLRSTNMVRALETGEELAYLGLPDPYERPCANPLSSHWV